MLEQKDKLSEEKVSEKISRWINETSNVHNALKRNDTNALIDVTPKFKMFVSDLPVSEQEYLKQNKYVNNEFSLTEEGYEYLLQLEDNLNKK